MDKEYYPTMLHRNRLVPFKYNGRLVCIITFYLGDDREVFIRTDPWTVMDDNEYGSVCYIDQLITDNYAENAHLSYGIWHDFKEYIKSRYPNVNQITWVRYHSKTGGRHVQIANLKRSRV